MLSIWLDGEANAAYLKNSDNLKRTLDFCAEFGADTVVFDAKAFPGFVLYPSRVAPMLPALEGKDLFAEVLAEGRKRGLRVQASMNVLVEGSLTYPHKTDIFNHPERQCVLYRNGSFVRSGEAADMHCGVFVNPLNEYNRRYAGTILGEIASYKPDGIVLARLRFPSIDADFSAESSEAFFRYIGGPVAMPADVLKGDLKKRWLAFRAQVIRGLLLELRGYAGNIPLGTYVGSWYDTYYELGANWASPRYTPKNLGWFTDEYRLGAYAEDVDFIYTGCYYPSVTAMDARMEGKQPKHSVEGAIDYSLEVIGGAAHTIPSIYVLQYQDRIEDFKRAVGLCLEKTGSAMIFDIVHIRNFGWDKKS